MIFKETSILTISIKRILEPSEVNNLFSGDFFFQIRLYHGVFGWPTTCQKTSQLNDFRIIWQINIKENRSTYDYLRKKYLPIINRTVSGLNGAQDPKKVGQIINRLHTKVSYEEPVINHVLR